MTARKKPDRLFLIILLATSLTFFACQPVSAASFDDLQGHWSSESVYRSAVLELINGYPDGKFRPEQDLSQMEALVLFMHAAGYEPDKSSKGAKNPALLNSKIPRVSWGQNYLNQAVLDGLIDENWLTHFQGEDDITRVQTAYLLCHLLQLPATAPIDEIMPFTDLDKVAPDYRSAIIAVSSAGIINGYEDGNFQPEAGLKRAEAASLLDRLLQGKWLKPVANRQVEGWIERIDYKRSPLEIELQSLEGSKKYKLSPYLKCFKNGQECPYQQIIYWRVNICLDSKKQVACISLLEKRNQGQENKMTGTLRAVALGKDSILTMVDLNGREHILPLSWGAKLDDKGKAKTKGFKNLKAGAFIDVYLTGGEINRVTVLNTKKVSASVREVDGNRLELDSKGSKSKTPGLFNYYERARIVDKDGQSENVLRGDKVKITYLDPDPEGIDDEIPLEIIITNRPAWKKVSGEVEKTSDSSRTRQLVLKKNKTYELDKSASICRESGSTIGFHFIKPGDRVEAMLDGAGIVMKITVASEDASSDAK